MTKTAKTGLWIGGLVLGVLAVGGVAYAATHKPAMTGPPPPASLTTSTSWTAGHVYIVGATVPSGVHDAGSLLGVLAANGWTNLQMLYFGPTGTVTPTSIPFSVDSSMYAVTGTWSGASGTPIPAGVTSVGA